MPKGGGVSGQTRQLQKLQSEQTRKAVMAQRHADSMQAEDQASLARRMNMGTLSNILTGGNGKSKLGQ